jgi:hypothetical protein
MIWRTSMNRWPNIAPEIFRLHMIGEPRIAPKMPKSKHAHERIDDWLAARRWIMDRFEGVPL